MVVTIDPNPDAPIMGRIEEMTTARVAIPRGAPGAGCCRSAARRRRRPRRRAPPAATAAARRRPPPPAPTAAPPRPPPSPARETPDAPFRQLAPPPGPEPTFKPPKPKRFKLKNGLEVMLVEFHDLPLVDFNLMIKTGGAANPPDRAGPGRSDRAHARRGDEDAQRARDRRRGRVARRHAVDGQHLGRVERQPVDAHAGTWTARWTSSPTSS